MSGRELIGLAYSPWTEKARWALGHHRVPYRYAEHLILFGMPTLRWKMRKPFGDLTVPALIDRSNGKTVRLGDSWDIARHAEVIGQGVPLFPADRLDEIRRLNDLSERALDAARACVLDRTRCDPATQCEVLPSFVPSFLRRPLRFIAGIGVNYIAQEFAAGARSVAEHEAELRRCLLELRGRIEKAGGGPLLEKFSYGDIAAAAMLHFVSPPASEYLKIGPATRACWTHGDLTHEFTDVVCWRDRIYQKHRRL